MLRSRVVMTTLTRLLEALPPEILYIEIFGKFIDVDLYILRYTLLSREKYSLAKLTSSHRQEICLYDVKYVCYFLDHEFVSYTEATTNACYVGNLSLLQYMMATDLPTYYRLKPEFHNRINMTEWLFINKRTRLNLLAEAMMTATEYGHFPLIQWYFENYTPNSAILEFCGHAGNMAIFDYFLAQESSFSEVEIVLDNHLQGILEGACENGHLSMIVELSKRYPSADLDYMRMIISACLRQRHEVLTWLLTNKITIGEIQLDLYRYGRIDSALMLSDYPPFLSFLEEQSIMINPSASDPLILHCIQGGLPKIKRLMKYFDYYNIGSDELEYFLIKIINSKNYAIIDYVLEELRKHEIEIPFYALTGSIKLGSRDIFNYLLPKIQEDRALLKETVTEFLGEVAAIDDLSWFQEMFQRFTMYHETIDKTHIMMRAASAPTDQVWKWLYSQGFPISYDMIINLVRAGHLSALKQIPQLKATIFYLYDRGHNFLASGSLLSSLIDAALQTNHIEIFLWLYSQDIYHDRGLSSQLCIEAPNVNYRDFLSIDIVAWIAQNRSIEAVFTANKDIIMSSPVLLQRFINNGLSL